MEQAVITNPKSFADKTALLDNKARQQQIEQEEKLDAELKKNHDFVQFTRKGLLKLSQLKSGLAHQIFHYLTKEMDRENKIIISQGTLAEIFEVTRQSISQAVKELIELELLTILKIGNANIYCLNAAIVWSQERDKIHLAKFNAKVIISKSEQEKFNQAKANSLKQIKIKE